MVLLYAGDESALPDAIKSDIKGKALVGQVALNGYWKKGVNFTVMYGEVDAT